MNLVMKKSDIRYSSLDPSMKALSWILQQTNLTWTKKFHYGRCPTISMLSDKQTDTQDAGEFSKWPSNFWLQFCCVDIFNLLVCGPCIERNCSGLCYDMLSDGTKLDTVFELQKHPTCAWRWPPHLAFHWAIPFSSRQHVF